MEIMVLFLLPEWLKPYMVEQVEQGQPQTQLVEQRQLTFMAVVVAAEQEMGVVALVNLVISGLPGKYQLLLSLELLMSVKAQL
jgi:hypothetical protein